VYYGVGLEICSKENVILITVKALHPSRIVNNEETKLCCCLKGRLLATLDRPRHEGNNVDEDTCEVYNGY
jgi:hypothetical protein